MDVLEDWLAGCDVHYVTDADAATVLGLEPDLIVVATGAEEFPPQIEGDGQVLGAWPVLAGARTGGRVLVADWGGD